MNYQGDLVASRSYFNPFQNKLALHINVAQPVNEVFDLNFFMIYGKLGADERTLERNLNFESQITSGGVSLSYNFSNFLKEDHLIEPFVSIGFEAFEFLSRTDLYDSYGNKYYYWSDGTIRNLAEEKENFSTAIEITRDYNYEHDIRALNADGFGDYSERAFAIPAGAGFNLIMNSKTSFQMGVEYHWTFTDYIDGITPDSRGIRAGNKQTDKFLHTFMRLTVNLTPTPHEEAPDFSGEDDMDTDLDSVPDFVDLCPNTPIGVEVDGVGCPLDSDGDGVADYLDAELNSPEGAIVDSSGVAYTDADFEQMYLEYTDESGMYSTYTNNSYSIETAERKTIRRKSKFTVKVGEFEGGINDSLANLLLSMPDVTTRTTPEGKTVIEVGSFENLPEAVQRKIELESAGIATQEVLETNSSGKTSRVTGVEQDMVAKEAYGMTVDEAIAKNKSLPAPDRLILSSDEYTLNRPIDERSVSRADDSQFGGQTVYRVQIGAFANKLNNDIFQDVKDLIVITTADGLTRYYTGAFTSYQQAASRKIDMLEIGFDGSHVIPFKEGQRNLLSESSEVVMANDVVPLTGNQYGSVKFKVHIGKYTGQIPTETLDQMMDLGRIDQRDEADGSTSYYVGEFNTFEEAEAYKEELLNQGFEGAFVGAEHNGTIISAEDGIQLINQQE